MRFKLYLHGLRRILIFNLKLLKFLFTVVAVLIYSTVIAQHDNKITANVNYTAKTIAVQQVITYHNQTGNTLQHIILNDWNNAYSGKNTPLAKRFSDEYVRAFHLASESERGSTTIESVYSSNNTAFTYERPEGYPDLIRLKLHRQLLPDEKINVYLNYTVKIPKDRFTRYGYNDKSIILKDWFLTPARYENGNFVQYSNVNTDDIANDVCNFEIKVNVPEGIAITTNLDKAPATGSPVKNQVLTGSMLTGFNLILEESESYKTVVDNNLSVISNMRDLKVNELDQVLLMNNITSFVKTNLGSYPYNKIVVSQHEYDRNPVYGLNQLPRFMNPFPDAFMYEVRFLKTYLNAYLKNTLKVNPRTDNWLYDAIQTNLMIRYINQYHPDKKMVGSLYRWPVLGRYHIFNVSFNEQYSYLYLLMARKNLDQPIGDSKDTFLKFNEQISGKYRAGLSMGYLDDYLESNVVEQSVKQFYELNKIQLTARQDFQDIVNSKTDKNTDWFFDTVINTRNLIDFKFGNVKKENNSLAVTIKNVTGTPVPVSVYGLKKGNVIFKKWYTGITSDSVVTIPGDSIEKLVINYNKEIPEFNERNNWKNLKKTFLNNRPYRFTFFQDLEDPRYNQVFYVPAFTYNLYDGFSVGLRIHNKSLLDKPFTFDIEPTYSSNTGQLIGSFSFVMNDNIREDELFNIRYAVSGSTFHYTPDASYIKFTPSIQFRFRDKDLRLNKRQNIVLRQVTVNREKSAFVNTESQNENYSVFNARYNKFEAELIRHYNFYTDVQLANTFGKLSGEIQYRRLFNNNRQVNLRLFAGMFMYRGTNSEFFSFGLDRPTDYLFDYNLYGRSETTGLFSQQYVMAEGGFKSKLDTRYANQFMTTFNASFNIWNWVEVYGDAGIFKNRFDAVKFGYDTGIRLNLVPDYFELYFPIQSSNGFALNDSGYARNIRFVVTVSPATIINLLTRKWF